MDWKMNPHTHYRQDVWLCDLGTPVGHEQGGKRPALVVSGTRFNLSGLELAIVIPCTTRHRGSPWHVKLDPPEGGVKHVSYIMCEQIQVMSHRRLLAQFGAVSQNTMQQVEQRLTWLLGLD